MNFVKSLALLVLVIALVPETSSNNTNFEAIGRATDNFIRNIINRKLSFFNAIINGKKRASNAVHRRIVRPIAQVKRRKLSAISGVLNSKTDILSRYIDRTA